MASMQVLVRDQLGNLAQITVEESYSPDVLDDIKARVRESYAMMLEEQSNAWTEEAANGEVPLTPEG